MDAVANLPPDVFLGLIGFAFACVNVYLLCLMVFLDYLDEGMPSPMRVEDSPHTRKRKSAWVVPKHMVRNPR
ncbi:unnamed protein product [Cladocopium goreaui]|uniref:Uncharacterized protein n=1 Tax=Cladocopium goreaui TaxID=2562237 RepID=A0A9P1G3T4_9DINO|nr:unnamed protein product [Cladocopium goreaui]